MFLLLCVLGASFAIAACFSGFADSQARQVPPGSIHPNSAEVEAHILKLARRYPRLVKVRDVIRSSEGRPIYAVTVTDSTVSDEDKQTVLIVAGQHGNEETSRMIALAILDWLVSKQGALTRKRQKVVVMPNVNPDAAEVDRHCTADGTYPNLDHGPDGAKTPEGKATEIMADELAPDLFVDMHACGGFGCSYDIVLYSEVQKNMEDDNILHAIAFDMVRAGEKAGIPNITHTLGWWGPFGRYDTSTTLMCYNKYRSLVIETETAESNQWTYPARLRNKSGLARMVTLLEYGNRKHPKFFYAGYPYWLMGMQSIGLTAVGKTAGARRQSRIAIWRRRELFEGPVAELPQHPTLKRLRMEYKGETIAEGVGVHFRATGKLDVQSVTVNGRKIGKSQTDGYFTWRDECSTFIVVAFKELHRGKYDIAIQFKQRRSS